jgi:polar amino acid transport system substrate-binding protein
MGRKCLVLAWATSALVLALSCTTTAQAADKCNPGAVAKKYPTLAGKTVRIGQSPTTPPYAFLESATSEQHTGFDADLARAVFGCIGVPIEF